MSAAQGYQDKLLSGVFILSYASANAQAEIVVIGIGQSGYKKQWEIS